MNKEERNTKRLDIKGQYHKIPTYYELEKSCWAEERMSPS